MAGEPRGPEFSALMAAAQGGDRRAYGELLRALTPVLRAMARRHWTMARVQDIEDVVQETLLAIHQARHTFDPGRPFLPWAGTILRHRLSDVRRAGQRRGRREAPIVDDLPAPAPSAEHATDVPTLTRAISRLPAGQRQAVELLKLKEMSLQEAASESGQSVGALKVAMHRALLRLRQLLGEAE